MKNFILIIIIIVSVSCNKDHVKKGDFPNPGVNIQYLDNNGNNLFSDGRNGYIIDNVRTYTLINGEKSIDSDQNNKLDYNPYVWRTIYDDETKDSVFVASFVLSVYKIDYVNEHYFTTLIDLKEGVQDTMRTFINGSKSIDSLWYNGKLLYTNPYFPQYYDMRKIITVEKEN